MDSGSAGRVSPDDEILDGLVKAATIQTEPRDHRRKARQFNRKSCMLFNFKYSRSYSTKFQIIFNKQ